MCSVLPREVFLRVTIEDGAERIVIDAGQVAKSGEAEPWDGSSIAARLVKSAPERRFTLCVAYPVNRPDVGIAADGCRDFAGPDAVEDAAWNYLRKGGGIGLWHQDGTDNAGTCVESYIWRGDDWVIKAADGSSQTVRNGDWLVGIVWTPETWNLIKSGRINGVSMQGTAVCRKRGRWPRGHWGIMGRQRYTRTWTGLRDCSSQPGRREPRSP